MLTPSQPSAVRGEMATRFREFDWGSTPLGPIERWPESWRNAVNIILDSSFPTALGLGSELIYFYNDAFIPLAGPSRHPHGLGVPVPIAWKEIWEQILKPRFDYTLSTGVPTGEADLLMPLQRTGYLEETFVTFSFAALRDAQSRPNGIFCTAIETTARVIADRQLVCLRALAAQGSLAETPEGACQSAIATLEANPRDLPFALLYLVERGSRRARLAGTVGMSSVPDTVPAFVDLTNGNDPWQLSVVAQTRSAASVENVQSLIGGVIRVADMSPGRAVALPIVSRGDSDLAAILVAGANPMRPLEESRTFHGLIAGHLETAMSNARAKQYARERAQALAELDRAKTLFFSNISHELRTPLTLLLAPLDETLARDRLEDTDRESLEIARRGGGRLLKLVNSLLEFSRIEAGRIEAAFEPADLAALTTDVASMFRSAFERASLTLTIDCDPAPEPVYVDRDKWEKIVLNLISNAFKFTFSGSVQVIQRTQADHIQLQVTDSGCGIAPEDLLRVFDRFFRGRAPQTRTHEGSGIGLSLVQELVKLHGGTIAARSELGQGTTMTVRIPRGSAHLDANRIAAPHPFPVSRVGLHAFVEEALGWLPDKPPRGAAIEFPPDPPVSERATSNLHDELPADILVVDDNADMRSYLCRLLEQRWRTEGATDGVSALERIRQRAPDLVIADVMMPRLDGFGLLRALREDQATAQTPIMLLSARAGEEASAEGLRAGADDYVIKPFSARELIARVEARLAQARLRAAERRGRDAAEKANQARDDFFAMLSHELRTPLMAVLGWTALLKGSRLGPEDMAYAVDIIERNARTQRRMIDDLLDVSRIVTGRLRIDARPIPSLAPVLAMVVDSFRPVAHGKGLTVVTDLANDAGPLRADPERLQQVAWNLLSNAIHFTPPGGRIEVRCSRQGSQAVLYVRDTGRGISQAAVPHIFERYWQGGSGTRPRRQGLGLGLAIAHRIVELHTGSIEAASEGEGRGSVFTVRLPIAEQLHAIEPGLPGTPADFEPLAAASARILDAATATAERDPDSAISGSPALQALGMTAPLRSANSDYSETSLRILLVEDHDGIARACQRLLVSHGHFVVRAAGAASALAAAEREKFDLVVCDLSLPDGSGLELLPQLRSCSSSPDIPAIAISGSVYEDDIARCLAAGFSAHVAKPFDEDRLLAVITEVMGQVARQGTEKITVAVGNGGVLSPVPARLR